MTTLKKLNNEFELGCGFSEKLCAGPLTLLQA
jgi:hypothetical protein